MCETLIDARLLAILNRYPQAGACERARLRASLRTMSYLELSQLLAAPQTASRLKLARQIDPALDAAFRRQAATEAGWASLLVGALLVGVLIS